MTTPTQHDSFGRSVTYLRVSVTDKCNYRCVYCMPPEGVAARDHTELLTAEETAHFIRLAAGEGIRRVRLTGGEPLVSRRLIPLIRAIRAIPQIEDISLTTNGALLPALAPALRDAGLDRVNISLDTLDPEQFVQITRTGHLEQALAGIDAALGFGFSPVKVNTVVVRRLHQNVLGLARLSVDRPIHVRFIEYMPIGSSSHAAGAEPHCLPGMGAAPLPRSARADGAAGTADSVCPGAWDESDVVPSAELVQTISAAGVAAGIGALEPAANAPGGAGPARYWRFPNAAGTVGFISAMSNHFCARCNRLRLTSDGTLRPCLFSDDEYSVREALRAHDDARAIEIYRAALAHKPKEHGRTGGAGRFMSQIGG
ncbi:GTP 3',8-cyclase MoaA [Collinsella tanakaei]|uniref:GTP 3',8-cyclase MoaA n=1 Tax=Collinsella tanakaei TaxID=626935 RepID=UPI0025A4927B|nr:GTP 3',8-cyclase MoaA [Collinsella tanakaei]MDM8300130.1 GTP 3',8-cyclase MoaA [Collinsella tanakaei]